MSEEHPTSSSFSLSPSSALTSPDIDMDNETLAAVTAPTSPNPELGIEMDTDRKDNKGKDKVDDLDEDAGEIKEKEVVKEESGLEVEKDKDKDQDKDIDGDFEETGTETEMRRGSLGLGLDGMMKLGNDKNDGEDGGSEDGSEKQPPTTTNGNGEGDGESPLVADEDEDKDVSSNDPEPNPASNNHLINTPIPLPQLGILDDSQSPQSNTSPGSLTPTTTTTRVPPIQEIDGSPLERKVPRSSDSLGSLDGLMMKDEEFLNGGDSSGGGGHHHRHPHPFTKMSPAPVMARRLPSLRFRNGNGERDGNKWKGKEKDKGMGMGRNGNGNGGSSEDEDGNEEDGGGETDGEVDDFRLEETETGTGIDEDLDDDDNSQLVYENGVAKSAKEEEVTQYEKEEEGDDDDDGEADRTAMPPLRSSSPVASTSATLLSDMDDSMIMTEENVPQDDDEEEDEKESLSISPDLSFVETTSLAAAKALAKFYSERAKKSRAEKMAKEAAAAAVEVGGGGDDGKKDGDGSGEKGVAVKGKKRRKTEGEMGNGGLELELDRDEGEGDGEVRESEYVITKREGKGGRTVYRIRPRSRPPSPATSTPSKAGHHSKERRRHSLSPSSPFSRTSHQPGQSPPSVTLSKSPPRRSGKESGGNERGGKPIALPRNILKLSRSMTTLKQGSLPSTSTVANAASTGSNSPRSHSHAQSQNATTGLLPAPASSLSSSAPQDSTSASSASSTGIRIIRPDAQGFYRPPGSAAAEGTVATGQLAPHRPAFNAPPAASPGIGMGTVFDNNGVFNDMGNGNRNRSGSLPSSVAGSTDGRGERIRSLPLSGGALDVTSRSLGYSGVIFDEPGGDGDVLGRLLGWTRPTIPSTPPLTTTTHHPTKLKKGKDKDRDKEKVREKEKEKEKETEKATNRGTGAKVELPEIFRRPIVPASVPPVAVARQTSPSVSSPTSEALGPVVDPNSPADGKESEDDRGSNGTISSRPASQISAASSSASAMTSTSASVADDERSLNQTQSRPGSGNRADIPRPDLGQEGADLPSDLVEELSSSIGSSSQKSSDPTSVSKAVSKDIGPAPPKSEQPISARGLKRKPGNIDTNASLRVSDGGLAKFRTSPFGAGVKIGEGFGPAPPLARTRSSAPPQSRSHSLEPDALESQVKPVPATAGLVAPSLSQRLLSEKHLPDHVVGPTVREAESFESIRTARCGVPGGKSGKDGEEGEEDKTMMPPLAELPSQPAVTRQKRKLEAFVENPAIFDIFHSFQPTSDDVSATTGESSTSEIKASATHSRKSSALNPSQLAAARKIEVNRSHFPGDDPRFVLWGFKHGHLMHRRPKANGGEVEDKGTDGTGTKRWSLKERKERKSTSATQAFDPQASTATSSSGSSRDSVTFQPTTHKLLMAATVERWVAELTSKIESDLLTDFFLTYRSFITPLSLLRLLVLRFRWAMIEPTSPEDEAGRRIVRVRTFVVIRHWLLNYFAEDFVPDRDLRTALTTWLNGASKDEAIKQNPKEQRLIKSLKKVVRRLKEMYTLLGPLQAAGMAKSLASDSSMSGHRPSVSHEAVPSSKEKVRSPMRAMVRRLSAGNALETMTQEKTSDEEVDLEIDGGGPKSRKVGPTTEELLSEMGVVTRDAPAPATSASVSAKSVPVSTPKGSQAKSSRQSSSGSVSFYSNKSGSEQHKKTGPLTATTDSPSVFLRSSSMRQHHNLPFMHQGFSRYIDRTMGTIGKFKRMLGSKGSPSTHAMASCVSPGTIETFEIEQTEGGDLLFSKGGLEAYLQFFLQNPESTMPPPMAPPGPEDSSSSTSGYQSTSDSAASSESVTTPNESDVSKGDENEGARTQQGTQEAYIAAASLELADQLGLDRQSLTPTASQALHHSLSAATIRSEASRPQSQVTSYHTPTPTAMTQNAPALERSSTVVPPKRRLLIVPGSAEQGAIQLDDLDFSDEDSDPGPKAPRTLRRLPGGNNLRLAGTMRNLAPMTIRDSVETMSSLGTQRVPSYDVARPLSLGSSVSTEDSEDAGGVPVVKNFVLDGIDSDEEDIGDVEAALRRLEGHVDENKQRERQRRVDAQMSKSMKLNMDSSQSERSSATRSSVSIDDAGSLISSSATDSARDSARHSVPQSESSAASGPRSLSPLSVRNDNPPSLPDALEPPTSAPPTSAKTPIIDTVPSHRHTRIASQPSNDVRASKEQRREERKAKSASRHISRKPSMRKFFANPPSRPHSSLGGKTSIPASLPPVHRSFLMSFRTETVAQQLCLIERDLFRAISWREMVEGSWRERKSQGEVLDWEQYLKSQRVKIMEAKQRGEKVEHSDVQAAIARFNIVANWVGSEIVLTQGYEERAALIAKFIRLSWKCYTHYNFQSVTQIVQGLQITPIERLRKTWARVPKWEMSIFRDLKTFTSHLKNFKGLRTSTNRIAEEWGPPGQGAGAAAKAAAARQSMNPTKGGKNIQLGCIPFLGIFLRDLTMNAELPTYLDPTSPSQPAELSPTSNQSLLSLADPTAFSHLPSLPPGITLKPLINVHKHRVQANVLQKVLSFQELAELYPYEAESGVYLTCLKLRCLSDRALRDLAAGLN